MTSKQLINVCSRRTASATAAQRLNASYSSSFSCCCSAKQSKARPRCRCVYDHSFEPLARRVEIAEAEFQAGVELSWLQRSWVPVKKPWMVDEDRIRWSVPFTNGDSSGLPLWLWIVIACSLVVVRATVRLQQH